MTTTSIVLAAITIFSVGLIFGGVLEGSEENEFCPRGGVAATVGACLLAITFLLAVGRGLA